MITNRKYKMVMNLVKSMRMLRTKDGMNREL